MLYRLRTRLARMWFLRQTRNILATDPMPVTPGPLSIVSMIASRDVQMYILAMKSFYRRIGRGKLIAIVARAGADEAMRQLDRHFPGITFQILEEIDVGPFQRGGCWERLVHILNLAQLEYVIQVDCDTLTTGTDLVEVTACLSANRAFTLSGGQRQIVSMAEAARLAREVNSSYVGIACEREFAQYPGATDLRYVRGSAGFAGFARGGFDPSRLLDFHRYMAQRLGNRWREWGTEQTSSNFAVANSPDGTVLPYPRYANFGPGHEVSHSSFLHFYGTHRFHADAYARSAKRVVAELSGAKD